MTRTSWQRIGGLPGLSLTVQDSGVPNLTLHGPPGLDELFRAMRRFVILKDLNVQAAKCCYDGVGGADGADDGKPAAEYEDAVISVRYVPLMR